MDDPHVDRDLVPGQPVPRVAVDLRPAELSSFTYTISFGDGVTKTLMHRPSSSSTMSTQRPAPTPSA